VTLRDLAKRLRRDDRPEDQPAEEPPDVLRYGLFDRKWYELQRDRTFADEHAAFGDYLGEGRVRGFSPHPLFEPAWYRPKDWRSADEDPLLTYLREGGGPGPHPAFDETLYLRSHPDASRHPGGALGHLVASATPETVVAGVGGDRPWGVLRSELVAAQQLWVTQHRQVGASSAPPADDAAALVTWADTVTLPEMDPLASVVLTVRNRATHLVAAIASVQQQSFSGWELLVVDDGSTDATPRVLELLGAQDGRLRVITTAGQGSSAARNAGIEAARGRYVAFLDADDIWSPGHLRVALATLVSRPCSAVHAMARRWRLGITYSAFPADPSDLVHRNRVTVSALVVERDILRQVGGFDPALPRFAEQDLGLKLARATTIVPVDFVAATNYDDPSLTDRASLTESARWTEVVTARQEFDWPTIAQEPRDHDLSVLVPDVLGWKAAVAAVRSARDVAPRAEVVVAQTGTRFDWTMLVVHRPAQGVRLLRTPVPRSPAFLTNLAFTHSRGRTVVVLPSGTTVVNGSVQRLAETLQATGSAAVAPVIRDREDRTPAMPGLTVAATSFAAAGGLDVLAAPGLEAADLVRRIAGDRPDAVVQEAAVEVDLTKRARAAYAPSTEGGTGD
jgi:hypothetical protein